MCLEWPSRIHYTEQYVKKNACRRYTRSRDQTTWSVAEIVQRRKCCGEKREVFAVPFAFGCAGGTVWAPRTKQLFHSQWPSSAQLGVRASCAANKDTKGRRETKEMCIWQLVLTRQLFFLVFFFYWNYQQIHKSCVRTAKLRRRILFILLWHRLVMLISVTLISIKRVKTPDVCVKTRDSCCVYYRYWVTCTNITKVTFILQHNLVFVLRYWFCFHFDFQFYFVFICTTNSGKSRHFWGVHAIHANKGRWYMEALGLMLCRWSGLNAIDSGDSTFTLPVRSITLIYIYNRGGQNISSIKNRTS